MSQGPYAIMSSMLEGLKQTLLVMGSILALIVVGWEIYLLVAYPGPYTFILFGATAPVFVIVGLGFFKLARSRVAK
ncbi:hypothetical protein ASG57_04485 [Bradyrhizobium sp. Leaf396]|nr:hypothetical protein ASG57_04485 [Bradyrhizobium sp. Leaf396]